MRLNNRGFAISSILYMALVLFLILILALLTMMGGRKNILDKVRKDTYNAINGIVESDTDNSETLDIAFPTMTDNMIPVVFSPTGVTLKADTTGNTNRNWYNYSQKKWANAVLVKESGTQTREYYKSASPGTIISTDDILAYFVWIPRYSYAVDTTDKVINIKFENKSVTSSGDGTGENYYTHPAFTFDEEALNGIWVGKFATSGTSAGSRDSTATGINILPGKEALTTLLYEEMFLNARKMELSGNIYGFSQTSTSYPAATGLISSDSNKVESYVLKNTEWGAIALLSQSIYGKNSDITVNDLYTGGGGGLAYLGNTSQSTTGNIYGIYDMVSSNGEFVMGYRTSNWLYLSDSTKPVNDKYYNNYDYYTGETKDGIQGDAATLDNLDNWHISTGVYEYPSSQRFFVRGQNSVFSYSSVASSKTGIGFRISLAIWE